MIRINLDKRIVREREAGRAYYLAHAGELRERAKVRTRAWQRANPERAAAKSREWREEHPERVREISRTSARANHDPHKARAKKLANYGMTVEAYEALHDRQGGLCRICGKPETLPMQRLSVDHDHTTGAVRGLLCSRHNKALGLFGDDPDLLRAALAYLEASK